MDFQDFEKSKHYKQTDINDRTLHSRVVIKVKITKKERYTLLLLQYSV